MVAIQRGQGIADPGPAREVRDRLGGPLERAVVVAAAEFVCDPGEPRSERERLHPAAGGHRGVQVLEQHPRVRGHRAGHVAHEHHRPRPARRRPPVTVDRLARGAERGAHDAPQIGCVPAAPRRPRAPREPRRPPAGELRNQQPSECHLGVRVRGKVLVAQQLDVAPCGRDRTQVAALRRRRRRSAGGEPGVRQRLLLDSAELVERGLADRPAAAVHRHEREIELREVTSGGAEHGSQREPRVLARGAVDRRERPVRVQQLADPDTRSLRPEGRCQLREPVRDTLGQLVGKLLGQPLRHRRAHLARSPVPGPRAPSARRRASRRGRRPRRAGAAPEPTRSSHPRRALVQVSLLAQPSDRGHDPARDRLGHAGDSRADDLALELGARVVDPVVQAPALERVVQLTGPVRGQDDDGPRGRGDRPELRNRDREVRQKFEQERLELVVGPVDLVDQQDHGSARVVLERFEQRPAQQEAAREQLALVDP